tara:strand:- start:2331 stop:2789 length:459 start_codon:yes stop_codon:yes gene_type:complete
LVNIIKKKKIHEFLGILSTFPFILIIFLYFIDQDNYLRYLNVTVFYLFIIISFIGAAYWGIALNFKNKNVKLAIFSVIPAILVNIIYLLNINLCISLIVGIFFINVIFLYEGKYLHNYIPTWYLKLRKRLNFTVTSLVLVIILITFNYEGYF